VEEVLVQELHHNRQPIHQQEVEIHHNQEDNKNPVAAVKRAAAEVKNLEEVVNIQEVEKANLIMLTATELDAEVG
jgi:hypothetical protein